jgi:catechol 2,3-dioxygenase-like lactoylglutathione lyase family enzyme
MTTSPRLTLAATTLDAPDPRRLAAFYRRRLGWTTKAEEPDWVEIAAPGGGAGLSFQTEPRFAPPRWPAGPGEQQMMMHLEIAVDDLPAAVGHALSLGATLAKFQPQEDVRVLLDPVGHPFCLFLEDGPGA